MNQTEKQREAFESARKVIAWYDEAIRLKERKNNHSGYAFSHGPELQEYYRLEKEWANHWHNGKVDMLHQAVSALKSLTCQPAQLTNTTLIGQIKELVMAWEPGVNLHETAHAIAGLLTQPAAEGDVGLDVSATLRSIRYWANAAAKADTKVTAIFYTVNARNHCDNALAALTAQPPAAIGGRDE